MPAPERPADTREAAHGSRTTRPGVGVANGSARFSFEDNYTTSLFPLVMANISPQAPQLVRGEGLTVWDAEGREYLDLCGQTLNLALGHRHPRVTEAVQDQMDRIWFVSSRFGSEPFLELSRRLVELAPPGLDSVHLKMCDGADAVETAIKVARLHTRRHRVLCLPGAWHGETIGTLGSSSRHRYAPVASHDGFCYSAQPTLPSLANAVREEAGGAAAVLVDPVAVSNGLFEPSTISPGLRELRAACDVTGTLLVFDELQTFGGYLGSGLFATDRFGVVPDLICLGKALGGGLPLAGTLCRREMRSLLRYGEAEFTSGGLALAARAGLAALDVLAEDRETLRRNQRAFEDAMRGVADRFPGLEHRGIGFFATFRPRETEPGPWVTQVVRQAAQAGLLVRNNHGLGLLVKPPVIIEEETSAAVGRRLAAVFERVPPVRAAPARSAGRSGRVVPPWVRWLPEVLPGARLRRRSPEEVARLAATLGAIGVDVRLDVSSAEQAGTCLSRVLARAGDDPTGRELANTVILHHHRWLEMAHAAGLLLGDRTAETAVFGRSGVVLSGLDWALEGASDLAAAFEEALGIADLLRHVPAIPVASDLRRRLATALEARHPGTGPVLLRRVEAALAGDRTAASHHTHNHDQAHLGVRQA